MAKKRVRRCIVWSCTNKTSEGKFVGDLCYPCHQFITRLDGRHSQAYRNSLQVVAWEAGKWIEGALAHLDPTSKGGG